MFLFLLSRKLLNVSDIIQLLASWFLRQCQKEWTVSAENNYFQIIIGKKDIFVFMVNDNGLNIYGTGPYRHKFKVLIIKEYLSGTQNFCYFKTDVQFFVHCSRIFWVKNILSHQMLQRNKQNKFDIKIIYLPNFGKTWNLGHWTHCWHQIESDTKYCTNITRVAPGSHSKSLPYTIHTNQFP